MLSGSTIRCCCCVLLLASLPWGSRHVRAAATGHAHAHQDTRTALDSLSNGPPWVTGGSIWSGPLEGEALPRAQEPLKHESGVSITPSSKANRFLLQAEHDTTSGGVCEYNVTGDTCQLSGTVYADALPETMQLQAMLRTFNCDRYQNFTFGNYTGCREDTPAHHQCRSQNIGGAQMCLPIGANGFVALGVLAQVFLPEKLNVITTVPSLATFPWPPLDDKFWCWPLNFGLRSLADVGSQCHALYLAAIRIGCLDGCPELAALDDMADICGAGSQSTCQAEVSNKAFDYWCTSGFSLNRSACGPITAFTPERLGTLPNNTIPDSFGLDPLSWWQATFASDVVHDPIQSILTIAIFFFVSEVFQRMALWDFRWSRGNTERKTLVARLSAIYQAYWWNVPLSDVPYCLCIIVVAHGVLLVLIELVVIFLGTALWLAQPKRSLFDRPIHVVLVDNPININASEEVIEQGCTASPWVIDGERYNSDSDMILEMDIAVCFHSRSKFSVSTGADPLLNSLIPQVLDLYASPGLFTWGVSGVDPGLQQRSNYFRTAAIAAFPVISGTKAETYDWVRVQTKLDWTPVLRTLDQILASHGCKRLGTGSDEFIDSFHTKLERGEADTWLLPLNSDCTAQQASAIEEDIFMFVKRHIDLTVREGTEGNGVNIAQLDADNAVIGCTLDEDMTVGSWLLTWVTVQLQAIVICVIGIVYCAVTYGDAFDAAEEAKKRVDDWMQKPSPDTSTAPAIGDVSPSPVQGSSQPISSSTATPLEASVQHPPSGPAPPADPPPAVAFTS